MWEAYTDDGITLSIRNTLLAIKQYTPRPFSCSGILRPLSCPRPLTVLSSNLHNRPFKTMPPANPRIIALFDVDGTLTPARKVSRPRGPLGSSLPLMTMSLTAGPS
jgi:hypothetical protein